MNLSKLGLAAILLCGSVSFAQEQEIISEAQKQETYAIQCGTLEQVATAIGQSAESITEDDKKVLQEIRGGTFEVLVGGEKAIQKLLDEGSKADTGGFGVLLACGMIEQIDSMIAEKGCLNLTTQETTKGEAGIAACKSVMKAVKAKQK